MSSIGIDGGGRCLRVRLQQTGVPHETLDELPEKRTFPRREALESNLGPAQDLAHQFGPYCDASLSQGERPLALVLLVSGGADVTEFEKCFNPPARGGLIYP